MSGRLTTVLASANSIPPAGPTLVQLSVRPDRKDFLPSAVSSEAQVELGAVSIMRTFETPHSKPMTSPALD